MPMIEATVFFTVSNHEKLRLERVEDTEQKWQIANDLIEKRYLAWEQDRTADFYNCFCEHGWHYSTFDTLCKHFHLTNWITLLTYKLGVFKGDELSGLYNELSTLLANLEYEFPVPVQVVIPMNHMLSDESLETYPIHVGQSVVLSPGNWDLTYEMDGMSMMTAFLSFLKTLEYSISKSQDERQCLLFGHIG